MGVIVARTYPPENMEVRRNVALRVLGPMDFLEDGSADLPCPGRHLHKKQDERRARLFLAGPPTLHCFHDSCRAELAELNDHLRREIGRAERGGAGFISDNVTIKTRPRGPSPAELRRKRWAELGSRLLRQALELYPMEPADLWENSPVYLTHDPAESFALFMRTLWRPHEIVWVGYNEQSGSPRHRENFKPAAVWAELGKPCGPQTCAYAFPAGCYSRKKANILARRHLVLESDTLTHAQAASVFWWVKERLELPLRAVVHSGSKSLHGWFAVPDEERLQELIGVLPVAGMDYAVLKTEGQPVRCPGWKREDGAGLMQALLYLDPQACEL